MSALQINTRPSDVATEERGHSLADIRAAVLADRATTVTARFAVGILVTVAVAIVVAGFATGSTFAVIGGGIGMAVTATGFIALWPSSEESSGH